MLENQIFDNFCVIAASLAEKNKHNKHTLHSSKTLPDRWKLAAMLLTRRRWNSPTFHGEATCWMQQNECLHPKPNNITYEQMLSQKESSLPSAIFVEVLH